MVTVVTEVPAATAVRPAAIAARVASVAVVRVAVAVVPAMAAVAVRGVAGIGEMGCRVACPSSYVDWGPA